MIDSNSKFKKIKKNLNRALSSCMRLSSNRSYQSECESNLGYYIRERKTQKFGSKQVKEYSFFRMGGGLVESL